ncbi:MAG TPA: GntR family transcriptional regulator [bacterium]|nr:GntR family transcriptional regulator [bacterium]
MPRLSSRTRDAGIQVRLPGTRTTLQQEAYRALRSAIIARRLQPGAKLLVRALAEELGLSPTPIKGALSALEREGLVVAIPHRGYFIPRMSPHDIEEIYALREVVEALAARLAASRADKQLPRRLKILIAGQRACVSSRDFERYGDLDLAFHQCIRKASGNGRLIRAAEAFDGQIRLLIDTSTRARTLATSVREHAAIADAVAANDPEAAETAMRRHVEAAGRALKLHFQTTLLVSLARA